MIKRLQRKLVFIVMAVVTLILLIIFFTMLLITQRNNERMSVDILRHALNMRSIPNMTISLPIENTPLPSVRATPNTRSPVLVVHIEQDGNIYVASNQLYFIEEDDIEPIAKIALDAGDNIGVLGDYKLRYLRETTDNGTLIAFTDISMEQEMLKSQISNSLLIGGAAMMVFFFLSLLLSRWAVRPVEIAWDRQKQFIGNASHELKTPLTVILSNADMLQTNKSFDDEKNARRIEHIHAEAVRMKYLVEDMLTIARSDSTEKPEVHDVVDFSYIVKNSVLMYEPIIYDEEKKFLYQIEDNISVMGDALSLQQVTHILLDNAQKYSPRGAMIRVSLCKSKHRFLLLKVSNDGEPIPKSELENIFLRFYRRDESRSAHESFGLGLSIAQSIIKSHKGKIWAESDVKSGNSFYITLPLIQ